VAADNERQAVNLLGRDALTEDEANDFERNLAELRESREEMLDNNATQAAANNGDNNQPAPMDHQDLMNVLRAAVLSARPKSTRLDEYNPVDHQQQIENTLNNWGLDPELVRPELTDVMTTSLDRKEIARWKEEFKSRDTSRGAGNKLFAKKAARPFYGVLRADLSKKQVATRIDHQVRHLNAQIDELVPGSKLRLNYEAGRSVDAAISATMGVVGAEVDASFQKSGNTEVEIRCSSDQYQCQIKPGDSWKGSLSAEVSASFLKFAKASGSIGASVQNVHFDGIILNFDRGDTPEEAEAAKRKMQTVLERMATGDDLSVDEWNSLTDGVQLVFENQNQGDLEGGLKAEVDATGNLLGSAASVGAELGASGKTHGRTKTHVIVDGDTTLLKSEKRYSYQAEIEAEVSAQVDFGTPANAQQNNLGDFNSSAKAAKNFKKGTDALGKASHVWGDQSNNVAAGFGLNVSAELGASTTWERRAYAKSQVAMDSTTGMIKKAELDFQATLNGHTMDSDDTRRKAAYGLLGRLASWSGHKQEFDACLTDANGDDTPVKTELDNLLRQTSGTDYLVFKLELSPSKMDEANEYLAQANALEDPTKGTVTPVKKGEAATLRRKAQLILNDRNNYVPNKVNLAPTQDDTISRQGDYIPGVSDLTSKPIVGDALAVGLAFTNPALSVTKSVGDAPSGLSPVTAKVTSQMIERSELKQEFGHERKLGYQAPQRQSSFAGMGDRAIIAPSPQRNTGQTGATNATSTNPTTVNPTGPIPASPMPTATTQAYGGNPANTPPPTSPNTQQTPPQSTSSPQSSSAQSANDQPAIGNQLPLEAVQFEQLNSANERLYQHRRSNKDKLASSQMNAMQNLYDGLASSGNFEKLKRQNANRRLEVDKAGDHDLQNLNFLGNYAAKSRINVRAKNGRFEFTERLDPVDAQNHKPVQVGGRGLPNNANIHQSGGRNCYVLATLQALQSSPRGANHLMNRINFGNADDPTATFTFRTADVSLQKSKSPSNYAAKDNDPSVELTMRAVDIATHYDLDSNVIGIQNRTGEVFEMFDLLEVPYTSMGARDLADAIPSEQNILQMKNEVTEYNKEVRALKQKNPNTKLEDIKEKKPKAPRLPEIPGAARLYGIDAVNHRDSDDDDLIAEDIVDRRVNALHEWQKQAGSSSNKKLQNVLEKS
ncbi:MAG: hypothetical protein AAFY56_15600, partial [Pseudomonadota bacterium]